MKKSLIIGMATIAVASTALIGSSIYATTNSGTTGGERTHKMQKMQKRGNETLTLSGVSTEAKSAFTDLQKKHKQEMDALRTQSGVTENQLQAKHEAFKTEMDALITKYPELKNALAQTGGKMGRENPMETILSGLSDTDKASVKSIHEEYKTKQETLRTEEKTKIDAIIAKYPDLKTKLDTMEKNRPQMGEGRGPRGMMDETGDQTGTSPSSN